MVYLELEDYFEYIFKDIRNLAYDDKQKPDYENQKEGLKKLESILELVKEDRYYPEFCKKAAYLFVTLSTGHIFSNGNKRIALFSFAYFFRRNGYTYRSITKAEYEKWFKTFFPKYKFSKIKFNTGFGWAWYNLNKAINIKKSEKPEGHEYDFNKLKEISENFLKFISRKKSRIKKKHSSGS